MRRADRLFQLVQLLRRRRVVTARALAEELEVSERTVYRDVQSLVRSGVPVRGEAGVGYALSPASTLPPLTFTRGELAALTLGARLVRAWADPELSGDAQAALARIEAVLPDALQGAGASAALFAPAFHVRESGRSGLAELRRAIDERRVVRLRYCRGDGERSARRIRPLGLFFWGHGWSVAGWCELRGGFRNFRLDRVIECEVLDARFDDEPGKSLADLMRAVG
ncbi:MAG: YafY family transcriptional regulator [Deltaproteobacteria bacterium]|nr:YafY family transcriptional regulator [Deltaproteobacteria bacterium]